MSASSALGAPPPRPPVFDPAFFAARSTAWAHVAYTARGEVRHLWNASPYEAPACLLLCDQGWVWQRSAGDIYRTPFYVPATGQQILMFDGARLVPVRVDRTLADAFAGRRERRALDQIILAPRGGPTAGRGGAP